MSTPPPKTPNEAFTEAPLGPPVELAGQAQTRKFDIAFAGGVAWSAGAKWLTQAVTWTAVVIAARILKTEDYGLAEMAGFFFVLTNFLAEFGIATAVIQMRELEPRVLAQLHTFTCIASALVYSLSMLAAPTVASFFMPGAAAGHRLTTIMYVANLAFLATGLQSVPFGLLMRDMDYRRLSISEACGALAQAFSTVAVALMGYGYWALIIGPLVGRVTIGILVAVWKHLPFAVPRWKDLRPALRMGGQSAVSRMAFAAYIQFDGIAIGRILGASSLGVYRMAMTLAAAPAEKISSLIMRVSGPLFAQVQDDSALARRYYLALVELLTLIELPLMLGMGVVAPEAISWALKQAQWGPVVGPVRWLVLFMTLRSLNTLTEQVLISKRKVGFTMTMSLLNFVVMPAAFVFAAPRWGTSGVAATWLALAPLTILPIIFRGTRSIQLHWRDFAMALLPAISAASVMVAGVVAFRHLVPLGSLPLTIRLFTNVLVGGLIYGGILMLFFRARVMRYVNFLLNLRREKWALAKARL